MLKNAKAKGKQLERYVADALRKIDGIAYARLDSGSGLHRKEDVFTKLPLFIECKNQAMPAIKSWWLQTTMGCPANKFPVLIYRLSYQKEPTVVMHFKDMLLFTVGKAPRNDDSIPTMMMHFNFNDFINFVNSSDHV